MTIQEKAQLISDNLTTIDLVDKSGYKDTRVIWKEDAPEKLKEWFSETNHKYTNTNLSELDEIYRVLEDMASIITDNSDGDADLEKINDAIMEYEWADIYNSDLLLWVNESLYRAEDVNEAIQEGTQELFPAIQMAQQRTREQMAMHFAEKLNDFDL